MSLKRLIAFDLTQFLLDAKAASGISNTTRMRGEDSSGQGDAVWLQSRDRIYLPIQVTSEGNVFSMKADPAFFNPNPPNTVIADSIGFPGNGYGIALGQYDPITKAQRFYCWQYNNQRLLRRIDPDTLIITAPAFTGINGDFEGNSGSLVSTSEGGWTYSDECALVFEGLTDGIEGETLNTGTNVYPDGLWLCSPSTGTVDGFTFGSGWCWVDISTRLAVGRLGGITHPTTFPCKVDASPAATEDQTEAPIAGAEFTWSAKAFVPDLDSLPTRPKGELFVISNRYVPNPSNSPLPGDTSFVYARWLDFNPTGLLALVGQPLRQHGRKIRTTRVLVELNPTFDLAGQSFQNGLSNARPSLFYDSIRRRVGLFGLNGTGAETVGFNAISFWSLTPDPVIVTPPVPLSTPRTNDVTDFNCHVQGDLQEPAGGLDVVWTLDRISTELESITISGGIGTTSTVQNGPIDDSAPSSAGGTLSVFADGVELVETTDYTVVLSTGVITWVTDQQGATTVQASYEHRGTPVQPAHGTLLATKSETDVRGDARTQVTYAENDALVGKLDLISSDLA